MIHLTLLQRAIREEQLHGWLFCNIRHRDVVADRLLNIPETAINSRQWFYYVPAAGEPVRIVHSVEGTLLDNLPGKRLVYYSRKQLIELLNELGGGTIAAQYSKELTGISYLDHGTALLLEEAGFTLRPSASLIQKTIGILRPDQITSHKKTAVQLYDIVELMWEMIQTSAKNEKTITEGEIRDRIMEEFSRRGLTTDHTPIVAAGANSSDPHYTATGKGEPLKKSDILQLDLFARENAPGSIYADISWVGVFDSTVPSHIEKAFKTVKTAREKAVAFINSRFSAGEDVLGSEVDELVRSFLCSQGYAEAIRHRTGHSIDTQIHGSGVNIDCVEFPDHRRIIEGSCFSIEPGVYLQEFGLRTEIDVVISGGRAVVSGKKPQEQLLVL
jgi:Xaa-Pro aminopeptidase